MSEIVEKTSDASSKVPYFQTSPEGKISIVVEDFAEFTQMFGNPKSDKFLDAMVNGCGNVSGRGEVLSEEKNYSLAIVSEIAPRDGLEAMLAVQMSAVHLAMIRHSRFLAGVENIPQLDVQEKVFNKLARTFTIQMEALRKHRHGGEQKVTVKHVTVNEGGKAIVGDVGVPKK